MYIVANDAIVTDQGTPTSVHARNENGVMLISMGIGIPLAFLGLPKMLEVSPFTIKSILPKSHSISIMQVFSWQYI